MFLILFSYIQFLDWLGKIYDKSLVQVFWRIIVMKMFFFVCVCMMHLCRVSVVSGPLGRCDLGGALEHCHSLACHLGVLYQLADVPLLDATPNTAHSYHTPSAPTATKGDIIY